MNAPVWPVWRLQWTLAFRRRRLLLLNVGIPLLLVLPLVTAGAPPFHAAAAYTVLFVLFGTFGSAIPLLRDGDGGSLRRMVLTGVAEPAFLAQRMLSGTAVDLVQLLPALALILAVGGAPLTLWLIALPTVAVAILAANLVGVWVAAIARSLAEGALFAAVIALFLLHGSGVFRTAAPGSLGALLEEALPFGPLHRVLLSAASGTGTGGGLLALWLPIGTTLILVTVTLLAAGALLERITTPVR